ncbi:hypothetical protein NM688_g9139 [Phlebia brevispora]|uniref:Uncharacterized protein n=1 Tax=Phlebia brevispora TaxID=194682 RepID=A0ACC1RKY1_9APHY|nr:hypothetical protein NM688_g9139 [Phlebia brevispora]
MPSPLTQSQSHSSDYFDNDPDYLRALQEVEIPGDGPSVPPAKVGPSRPQEPAREMPPPTQIGQKRRRSPGEEEEESGSARHRVLKSIDQDPSKAGYLASDTYGASHFGAWGEYMSRKRAKLQIQNAEMDEEEPVVQKSRIFKGLQIYINGYTEPSVQDLRKLIIQHGGVFHAYLDRKSLV